MLAVLLLSLLPAVERGEVDATMPAIGRITSGNLLVSRTCTGTLIGPDLVLTAAHCVYPAGELTFDVTGEDGTSTVQGFGVATALAHPEFAPQGDDAPNDGTHALNDVGILKLREAVPDDVAAPLRIRRGALDEDIGGENVRAVGYGATRSGPPGIKRSVELFIGTLLEDSYSLIGIDTSEATNTGTVEIDKGLCRGDSGGPDLMRAGDDDTFEIVGVHALGSAVCSLSESTRLDNHVERFIDPVLAGEVPAGCTGDSLDDAVCNEALESGGCSATRNADASWLLGAALSLALHRRRRRS